MSPVSWRGIRWGLSSKKKKSRKEMKDDIKTFGFTRSRTQSHRRVLRMGKMCSDLRLNRITLAALQR